MASALVAGYDGRSDRRSEARLETDLDVSDGGASSTMCLRRPDRYAMMVGIVAVRLVPFSGGVEDVEMAAERLDPVGEAAQTGSEGRFGASTAVVADHGGDRSGRRGDVEPRPRSGVGVLGDIRQRL